jgi:hypothetical protein
MRTTRTALRTRPPPEAVSLRWHVGSDVEGRAHDVLDEGLGEALGHGLGRLPPGGAVGGNGHMGGEPFETPTWDGSGLVLTRYAVEPAAAARIAHICRSAPVLPTSAERTEHRPRWRPLPPGR